MTFRTYKIIRRARLDRRQAPRPELDRRGELILIEQARQLAAGEIILSPAEKSA